MALSTADFFTVAAHGSRLPQFNTANIILRDSVNQLDPAKRCPPPTALDSSLQALFALVLSQERLQGTNLI